jgi:hypothetical protein
VHELSQEPTAWSRAEVFVTFVAPVVRPEQPAGAPMAHSPSAIANSLFISGNRRAARV